VEPALHPDLAAVAFLLGTWQGEGKGSYPTSDAFEYAEEIRFTHSGKPLLAYTQRTWHPAKGFAMHAEAGFWRIQPEGRIEIVLAHPTGIAEIEEGTIRGTTIEVGTSSVSRSSTAKEVNRLERTITVDGDVMRYEVRMAAVGVPLTTHLTAELHRVES
jgi:nitrobindin-like protein